MNRSRKPLLFAIVAALLLVAASVTPRAASKQTQQSRAANPHGTVSVNTDSGIYHKPGGRYYGKTKQRNYMLEANAIKAGYRPAGKK